MEGINEIVTRMKDGSGKTKNVADLAGDVLGFFESQYTLDVIACSHFDWSNLMWSFGRSILHEKFVKKYYLDTDKIRADRLYCNGLMKATVAIQGRFLDRITSMFANAVLGMNPNRMGNRIRDMLGFAGGGSRDRGF